MAQHDYDIANQTGAGFRADLNNALSAIATVNSGPTAPNPSFANQLWADTTANKLKQRNTANTAWVEVGDLNSANLGLLTAATGNSSYVALTGNQTIAGTKTFSTTPVVGTATTTTNNTSAASTAYVVNRVANDAPTKTGGGASGTWGINISGNAATSTTAGNVTGTVPIANGGTGQTTASAAANALLPAQAGKAGQVLSTNGSALSWEAPPGAGGTSVYMDAYSKAFARVGGGTATYATANVEYVISDGTNILLTGATAARVDRATFSSQTPVAAGTGISGTATIYFPATNGTGTWIIPSTSGNIWRTTNLVSGSWSSINVGHTANLNGGVVWTGTYFVAIGGSGQVRRSTDGVTWSDPYGTTLPSSTYHSTLYANGVLTTANNNATTFTHAWSFDEGATWSTVSGATGRSVEFFVNDRGEMIGREFAAARFNKRYINEIIEHKTGKSYYYSGSFRSAWADSGSGATRLATLYCKGYCITNATSGFLVYAPDLNDTALNFFEGSTSGTFNVAASGSPSVTALWYDAAQDRVLVGFNNGTYSICTFE